jgi:hypothetical protein
LAYYGAPIAENKVVVATEGVPIKTFKPDAATKSVAPKAPAAGTVDAVDAGIASLPNNAYKPVAASPLSLTAAAPFNTATVVIFAPTGGLPTFVLIMPSSL